MDLSNLQAAAGSAHSDNFRRGPVSYTHLTLPTKA